MDESHETLMNLKSSILISSHQHHPGQCLISVLHVSSVIHVSCYNNFLESLTKLQNVIASSDLFEESNLSCLFVSPIYQRLELHYGTSPVLRRRLS